MKQIRFVLRNILFASSVILVLAGCSNKHRDGSIDPDSEEIHIRVWESNAGPEEWIKKAAAEYHKTHPNVFVDYLFVDIDTATSHMLEEGPEGIGADLFAAPHDKLGQLVSAGAILPTVNPDEVQKEVLGACSKALNYNGTMYGYPICAETYALFYNKNLIKENEVPKTWDDMQRWCQKFNAENPGKKGFVMDFMNAYYGIVFLTGDNNHLFGEYGTDPSTPNISTPYAIKMMTYFQSLRHGLGLEDIQLSTPSCDGMFVSGHAAMHVTGLWNVKKFENAGIDFGVTTLPSLPGDSKPASSFSGTRGMFVSSWSKHPAEAADFARFLLTPEMQSLRYEITGAMPAISIKTNDYYMDGFINQLNYAFPMPSIPQMTGFWSHMGDAIWYIWIGNDPKSELENCNNLILQQ